MSTPPIPAVPRLPTADLARVTFDPATPRDADLVRSWCRQSHVSPWWPEYAGTLAEAEAVLDERCADSHSKPWILHLDERPVGYIEAYVVADDVLARLYEASPGDRGWHVLVGPPELRGTGITRLLGRAVLARLFAEPGCDRVVCDPDVRNERMAAFCRRLGHEPLARIVHPERLALLMVCTPTRFDELWPGDRQVVARAGSAPLTPAS